MGKRLLLQHIGKVNGVDAFAPMDQSDVEAISDRRILVCDLKHDKCTRTELQNRAIHLYCTWLADALNAAGYGMSYVMRILSKNQDIPWSMESVKERLWRPTQKHTFGKDSTTKLNTDEVGTVYEALNLCTSDKLGVSVNFPDKFMKAYEAEAARFDSSRRGSNGANQ